MSPGRGGGGGGAVIFSYMHRFGSFFWVQNFDFYIFGFFFQKNDYFWGMKIFRGSTQNWTIFSGHFYAF